MHHELVQAVKDCIASLYSVDIDVALTRPDEKYGDYATNAALQLSGRLGRPPREIAEELAAKLREQQSDTIADVSIAGPGFINITVTDKVLHGLADAKPDQSLVGRTILAEYSDPNPYKPLHAGHLYTTLVGDTIARLLECAGAHVVRLNYGGDVGLHVGKAMWGIIQKLGGEYPDKLAAIPELERAKWLGARYVEGNTASESDEAAKAEIVDTNKRVYQVHATNDHESPFAQIYWTTRQWSYDYFAVLYQELQVAPFDRYIPESEVTPLGLQTVREQLDAGVYQHSEGAVVYPGEADGLHTRVFINSAGLPTYEAKDVGLLLTKWRDYHYDKSIYITANEQAQYMAVMFASVAKFEPEAVERCSHLTHGIVKMQGGVKISSRKGNGILALDILEAARAAAAASANGDNSSEETVLAAVKYAFAKNRIGGDIVYDPTESIALEGNSGPYLQYAHARARSIIAKADGTGAAIPDTASPEGADPYQPAERSLLRKLGEYAETVDRAVAELMPHHICTYLYELAQTFNRFYENNRVIGDDRQALRLQLVARYADTLKQGLSLLGITAPDRM